ncbi:MAG TPA: DUF6132 family protein [Saprospiraceae bacterium]|nr:DUF6132 family protein [Saprospiraceae bacterium]
MNFIIENKNTILGILSGAVVGFLYYYYIGCANGTCAISSKPLNSSIYGAVMGGLFVNIFKKEK